MGVIIKFENYEGGVFLESSNCDDLIVIDIEDQSGCKFIELDIDTAVKFSKELRRQIAIAKDFKLNSEDNE